MGFHKFACGILQLKCLSRLARSSTLALLTLIFALLSPSLAQAYGEQFQKYFYEACLAPVGALALRCAETPDGLGNLSADSESSLEPNMGLSLNDGALRSAKEKSREFVDGEEAGEGQSGFTIDVGPFTVLANLRSAELEAPRIQNVDRERGNSTDSVVGELGIDYRVSEQAVVGVMLGFESADITFKRNQAGLNFTPQTNSGDIKRDAWSLIAFGSFNPTESSYLQASAGWTSAELDITRRGTFQEWTRTLQQVDSVNSATADADDRWASVGAGWTKPFHSWSFTLNSSLTWASATTESYVETDVSGSGLAMQIGSVDRDSLLGSVGVSVDKAILTDYGVWVPYVSLDYEYEFDYDPDTITAKYVLDNGPTTFSWTGDVIDASSYLVGAGAQLVLPHGMAVFLDYREQVGNDSYEMRQATLGMRYEL